jgi:hypothetical protein
VTENWVQPAELYLPLTEFERKLIFQFFNCKSKEERESALRRVESMLSWGGRDIEPTQGAILILALELASELHPGFANLSEPPSETPSKAIPENIEELIDKYRYYKIGGMSASRLEILTWMKKNNKIDVDLAASTIEHRVREKKRLVKLSEVDVAEVFSVERIDEIVNASQNVPDEEFQKTE